MSYRPGDFWRIDDRTGSKVRSSDTVKQWDGLIVHRDEYEERHPQDFVRGRIDKQRVHDPRPEPTDNIIGPLTATVSADASPGATTLNLDSSVRMQQGDHLGITLASGNVFRAVINTVPTSASITLTAGTALPDSVAAGALVVDYDAVAEATLP